MRMLVECIKDREIADPITVGSYYHIETDSLYIEDDGTAYADVYNEENTEKIGRYSINIFCTIGY